MENKITEGGGKVLVAVARKQGTGGSTTGHILKDCKLCWEMAFCFFSIPGARNGRFSVPAGVSPVWIRLIHYCRFRVSF